MHPILVEIRSRLSNIITQLQNVIPNDTPFSTAHQNWAFPGLSRSDLISQTQELIDLIDLRSVDDLSGNEARVRVYANSLEFLLANTIPHIWGGNCQAATSSFVLTLQGLHNVLQSVFSADPQRETAKTFRRVQIHLRGMEARLTDMGPRTDTLASMLERIESANEAADQLPTDLETLAEAQKRVANLEQLAMKDQGKILNLRETAEENDRALKDSADAASKVLEQCQSAYSAATSVGLAAAFSERSTSLTTSMWIWVAGLVIALGTGGFLGSIRLHALSELLNTPGAAPSAINLNLLLSLLSVGAPIWFAWLATKQIGQRFRLSEDYAFKASVSRAYEGFRREAARFDKEMESKLLESALTRLDELPLRLVEAGSYGSPIHELMASDTIKQAIKIVPGFADNVKELATKSLSSIKVTRKTNSAVPTAANEVEN